MGADVPAQVYLPVRPALRPVPLADDAEIAEILPELAELGRVAWARAPRAAGAVWGGVWEPRTGGRVQTVLEAAVRDEFKRIV